MGLRAMTAAAILFTSALIAPSAGSVPVAPEDGWIRSEPVAAIGVPRVRSLDARGNSGLWIFGPQLSGGRWLAIADTDGGGLDGDLEWDRAVGPMQFLLTSWALCGADGNGDGVADPDNLYDAALAASGSDPVGG